MQTSLVSCCPSSWLEASKLLSAPRLQGYKGSKGDMGMPGASGEKGATGLPGLPVRLPRLGRSDLRTRPGTLTKSSVLQGVNAVKGDKGDPGLPGPQGLSVGPRRLDSRFVTTSRGTSPCDPCRSVDLQDPRDHMDLQDPW